MGRDLAGNQTSSVTDEITNILGSEILGGLFPPGATLLGEEEVCVRFGASRSAAREAVKILSAKGLLLTRPRRGSRIRPMKDWNFLDPSVLGWLRESATPRHFIIELLEVRLAFECEAAALAASRNDTNEIAAIREAFEAMRAASTGQGDPVSSDAAFHEAVLAATGNRFFLPLSALIHTALQYSVPTTNALFGHPVGDLHAHGKVLRAIEAGDAATARQAMHEMLSEVLARVRSAVELTGAS
ncbi:MAG: FadR family transcriptional regulator [Mesorhizobium sp.]|nr:MAG: FadR family transcriptional regulator [Mesorhizobium sp.]